MNRLIVYALLAASVPLLFSGCSSKKDSTEACVHQVSMDLDKGNYDAVLASSCADAMQRGAAYFGRAGFDITNVINTLSETGVISGTTGTRTNLTIYMTSLVTAVTGSSLTDLDDADGEYASIPITSESYQDAQFYISLVDIVKALSLMKIVVPVSATVGGALDTTCDQNANGVPDEADATACALLVSDGQTCGAWATVAQSSDLVFSGSTGTYTGLTITMQGTGSAPNPPCPVVYQRLLFQQGTGSIIAVTTPDQTCPANDGSSWPCPVVRNNQPIDLVTTVNQSISGSVGSLNTAITGTTSTDVQTSIQDIQAQACCGCTATPCSPCATPCTALSIASYLQTNLK